MTDRSPAPSENASRLTITRRADAEGVVLELTGEMDLESAPSVVRHLREIELMSPPRLLIDLSGVEFMDSSGLRVLVEARRTLPEHGVRLTLRHGPRQVERLFEITGVRSGFEFEP